MTRLEPHLGAGEGRPADAESRRRSRNAELVGWACAAASAALLAHAVEQRAAPAILLIVAGGGVLYAGAAVLARRGVRWAAAPLVAGPLLSIVGAVAANGRLGAAPYYAGVAVIVAAATLPPRQVAWSALAAFGAIAAMWLAARGVPQPALDAAAILTNALVLTALSALVGVLHSLSSARALRESGRLAEQLWHSQKMEALGRLAGGVAHDFNNLLMVIDSGAALAAEALPAGHPAAGELSDVQKASERAAAITRQLLAFSRRQVTAAERVDVARAVGDISELLPRLLGVNVQLTVDLEPGLWPVAATPVQIEQVVLNLAANARDAMPAGGRFAVRGRNRSLGPGEAGRLGGGDYVELTFADTGGGLSQEALDHLFEPFFTTKATAGGSGLGLATCYGIAAQLGGAILGASRPGQGATFTVLLPRLADSVQGSAAGPETPVPSGPPPGAGTVLVVDDEPAVRGLMSRVVRAAGHAVLDAGSAAAALDLARRHPTIDVVLCDVQLGGETAFGMLDELRRLRPGVRVVLTSGYAQDPRAVAGYVSGGGDFLPKPFLPESLTRAVERALRHRRGKGERHSRRGT